MAKEAKPGMTNGYDGNKISSFLDRVKNLEEEIASIMGGAMAEAKQRLRATADDFTTARKLSDRAGLVLRDRFGIDPKTGRKVRKVRNLLDLTG